MLIHQPDGLDSLLSAWETIPRAKTHSTVSHSPWAPSRSQPHRCTCICINQQQNKNLQWRRKCVSVPAASALHNILQHYARGGTRVWRRPQHMIPARGLTRRAALKHSCNHKYSSSMHFDKKYYFQAAINSGRAISIQTRGNSICKHDKNKDFDFCTFTVC